MKMAKCTFTYPGNATPTLFDITVQVRRIGAVEALAKPLCPV